MKNTITLIAQFVDGGDYDLFPTFYYLKHFHQGDSVFIEACNEGVNVIQRKYKNDKRYVKVNGNYPHAFQFFLRGITESIPHSDVYVSLNNTFARRFLRMLYEVETLKLPYRDAFGFLKHELEVKMLLTTDRSESTFPFVRQVRLYLPLRYNYHVYLDCPYNAAFTKEVLQIITSENVTQIHGFNERKQLLDEMVFYFNNHLDGFYGLTEVKPLLDKLN